MTAFVVENGTLVPADPSCGWCGDPVYGLRRNGKYCKQECRRAAATDRGRKRRAAA